MGAAMSYLLPHLNSGFAVDQAILSVCALAAWLSLRQVFKLEPAIVFKA